MEACAISRPLTPPRDSPRAPGGGGGGGGRREEGGRRRRRRREEEEEGGGGNRIYKKQTFAVGIFI